MGGRVGREREWNTVTVVGDFLVVAGSLKEFMKAKSFSSAAWSRWKRRGFLNVAIFYEKTL